MIRHPFPALVDARTGIVKRLRRHPVHPHLPRPLNLFASTIADTTRFSVWPSDPSGMGSVLGDAEAAIAAALGEAVERYCGNLVPPDLVAASYNDLVARGHHAVDPEALSLYSRAQYETRGFPFVPFTRDLMVRWARGRELRSGAPVWVPAASVWVTYPHAAAHGEPPTNGTIYAGIAAGPSREAAEWSALCELVERDALTLVWTAGAVGQMIEPPEWVADLARGPCAALRTRFFRLPNDLGIAVVGAVMTDESAGYLTLGLSCRPDPLDAMLKALAEAAHVQMVMRHLDDPTSAMAHLGERSESPLKPWRPARDYLSAYRADWRDATDPGCDLQLYLDPAMCRRFEAELDSWPSDETSLMPADGGGRAGSASGLGTAGIVARLADQGISVYSVDVTTDDVWSAGMHVVRLVAPGLYSNAPAAHPFLGGRRLQQVHERAGGPMRLFPLPH